MKTTFQTSIITLIATAFSMNVHAQVISQVLAGDVVGAIEIYNPSSSNTLTLTSANFKVVVSVDNKLQNNITWTPPSTSTITLLPRKNLVIIGAGTQQAALITYLQNVIGASANVDYFVTTLLIQDKDAIKLELDNVVTDGIGEFQSSGNADWCKNCNLGTATIDDYNWERDLEYLETTFSSGITAQVLTGMSTSGFQSVYQPIAAMSATGGYDVNDFEGFGISPGNIKLDGTNWYNSANPGGTSSVPSSQNCHIEVIENSTAVVTTVHKVSELVVASTATVTLSADATGFAQAKKIRVRGSGTPSIKSEKVLTNDGWHLIGTPFPNGFNNVEGRGVNANYWFWNGAGWTSGTSSTVPAGQGLMVRVGSAYSYSYTGGTGGTIRTGNGGTSNPYTSFTWDRTGSADGELYYLADGHSSTSQGSGWNLLSNPFTCALDWNAVYDNGATTNIDATIQIWDPTSNGWLTFNAADNVSTGVQDGLIPPNTAFLVKVSSDAAASIAVNIETHGVMTDPSSIFNKNQSYDRDVLNIALRDVNTSATSIFIISDVSYATANYDLGLDTWKKTITGDGTPDIFYTDGAFGEISQNLTNLSVSQSMNLETKDLIAGKSYDIIADQFVEGNPYHISLEDTYLQTICDISNSSYRFVQPNETINNRFILHINQNTVGLDEYVDTDAFTYLNGSQLMFNPGSANISLIRVLSTDGRLIAELSDIQSEAVLCNLSSHGMYLVQIKTETKWVTKKLIY